MVDFQTAGHDRLPWAEANPGFRDLGAGVFGITYRSVAFDPSGSTAKIDARVSVWAAGADRQPDGTWAEYHPEGDLNVHAEMAKYASGDWKMTSMSWDFAPGSEP